MTAAHTVILRGGRVIDPASGTDGVRDVIIQDGKFADSATSAGAEVVDVTGLVVAPGFIDMHVHLRDPGQTAKEDLTTGARAAAAGGFTTILAMPNTVPTVDEPGILKGILQRAESDAPIHVLQSGALSRGLRGQELSDARKLKEAGATALTDDGATIQNAALMKQALVQARLAGLPVLDHCEELELARGGTLNDGAVSIRLKLKGKPASSEEIMVARNALLAAETGCHVHMQHISTARGVELIRLARRLGWPVSGEAAPHHFCLTEEAILKWGANAKMNPPLRTEADRQAVFQAVCDGTLSVIATDHAPHTAEEKAQPLDQAPNGIIGLEAAVSLALELLYHGGRMPLLDLVARFTTGPAAVLKLPCGRIAPGCPGDVTLLDLNRQWTISTATFLSKARNCPYDGWTCRGLAVGTLVAGKWAHRAEF